jgi:hypothetical protein
MFFLLSSDCLLSLVSDPDNGCSTFLRNICAEEGPGYITYFNSEHKVVVTIVPLRDVMSHNTI